MTRDWSTTRTRHGTPSGWSKHKELGEEPCEACYQARQEYDRRRSASPENLQRSRISARAQNKAYGDLAALYPEKYAKLYAKYKQQFTEESTQS